MSDCLFCKIVAGEIPSTKVYEDEYVYAFNDINPMAPVHVLVVPKKHIKNADEIDGENSLYVAKIFEAVAKIEKSHEDRYQALLKALNEGKVFERPTKVIWECGNCGFRVEGTNAPAKCPVCDHPQAYFFELQETF